MASIETQSKISIISKAIVLCGEKSINSLSANRYAAEVGSNLFEILYENELQSNRWRFAMNKKALSRLANVPLNEWQFAYQLPSDMLLPIGIFPKCNYEIYGSRIYADVSSVELDYQFKPDVSACPPYFNLLMVYAMAKNMIKPMTESDTAVTVMDAAYKRQRAIAMFADAQGRPNKPMTDSPFTANR